MRLVWLLALLATGCAVNQYDPQPSLTDFCQREPGHQLCVVQDINQQGNARFKLHADEHDRWHTTGVLGDCEDYALWKYQWLYEAGLTPRLLIYRRDVGMFHSFHAVTTVELDGTIWVLDNETDTIRRLSRAEKIGAVLL